MSFESFSEEGEDMILRYLFKNKRGTGFYVDVGAHHPTKFNNTYHFYKSGWKGINIDPLPQGMDCFWNERPRDFGFEVAISDKEEELDYYMFNESLCNTFNKKIADQRDGDAKGRKLIDVKRVKAMRLDSVLDQTLPGHTQIDFFSIDVEGHELEVLRSNDWKKYSPKIIAVEILHKSVEELVDDEVFKYLKSKGYELVAKTVQTCFFRWKK